MLWTHEALLKKVLQASLDESDVLGISHLLVFLGSLVSILVLPKKIPVVS